MKAVAVSQPPKAGRNWAKYNAAQVAEGSLFDGLLWDLVQLLQEPPQSMGRPRLPLREVMFCIVKKCHTGHSSRRNQGEIESAVTEGLLTRAPHYNAASALMLKPDTERLLRWLVQVSAMPLAGIETGFAVDSTGFATDTHGSYRTLRYGETRKQQWVKLHACVGVKTNIITDAVATDGHGADSPQFPSLVHGTAKAFRVKEVYADKAYSGKANLWAVDRLRAYPYIPFKGGRSTPADTLRTQGATGLHGSARLWRKAFLYFQLHEDEFMARYHQRSNVESTFSAMKHRMVEKLKAKNLQAQKAEVLAKAVAWNITALVRAMHEHDVAPDFGAPRTTAPAFPT